MRIRGLPRTPRERVRGRLTSGTAVMLAVANIRTRWTSFVGAFVAVCLGVALVTMTMLVWASSTAKVPPRVDGAALVILAPQVPNENDTPSDRKPWSATESAKLAGRLATVPGVAQAVPDRSFYAQATRSGAPVAAGEEALPPGHRCAA